MESKELRIGNLVKSGNGIYPVFFTSNDNDIAIEKDGSIFMSDVTIIKPIPLGEIIEKLGFSDKDYKEGYIGIDIKSDTGITTDFVLTKPKIMGEWQDCFVFDLPSNRFTEVRYVHELQNLFFAITKQELTLTI